MAGLRCSNSCRWTEVGHRSPISGRNARTGNLTIVCSNRLQFSTTNISDANFAELRKDYGLQRRPVVSRVNLGTTVLCSAYGSTNGNGRPGRGIYKPTEGFNSGLLNEEPKISKDQTSDGYSQPGFNPDRISEAPSNRGGRIFGSTAGKDRENRAGEKQGEDPYRILDDGSKVYLDELDVITLLEPPPFLRPLKGVNYNHAAFLWKKIGDIPEERRHRLLDFLQQRHIKKMWELSELRYEAPYLFTEDAADMLPRPELPGQRKPMVWDGRVIQVPWYLSPFSRFQKVFFIGNDSKVYGRVITGGRFLSRLSDKFAPLYFEVRDADSVMATEEPCDLVLEYGEGHLHLRNSIPKGFVNPVKHLPPFNDKACDYLRAVGPGVMVGQAWVEGITLEQVPRRLFGEFIMVRRFQ